MIVLSKTPEKALRDILNKILAVKREEVAAAPILRIEKGRCRSAASCAKTASARAHAIRPVKPGSYKTSR